MDVKKELEKTREEIDKEIEKILPREITKEWLELALGKADYAYDTETLSEEVSVPIWDFIDRGGKRWRPALMLWCCEAVGGEKKVALPFTVMPELIHSGTIMIDDLEDSADIRRGKPCTHKLFGVDTAANDSNVLYFLPTILLYRNLHGLSEEQRREIYGLFCEEMLRVSLGQAMDIHWHKGGREKVSEEEYLQMCVYKTGVLARFSAKLGGILGGASEELIFALGKFGESLGVGFQIQDDILNLVPESDEWGKDTGEDISEGKMTLLVLYTLEKAEEKDAERLREILGMHSKEKKVIEEAIEIVKKYGAIEYAKGKAVEIVEKSWKKLDGMLEESEAKEKLKGFADFCIKREI